jgi:hypothetical protein
MAKKTTEPTPAPDLPSAFERLAAVNVGAYIEKKNGLSYLSWAWAWDQLKRQDPAASYHYLTSTTHGNDSVMVYCSVTAFGQTYTAHLPVMDHRHKAIASPDAFAVNTAMQRCLVKAIALHGLGLYIYSGEDLPLSDPDARGAATPAPPAIPAGYDTFLEEMATAAKGGMRALLGVLKADSREPHKARLRTDKANWGGLKAIADTADASLDDEATI